MEIWIIYPLLCCLLPVHILYRKNISETSLKQYFYTVFLFTLLIGVLNTIVQVIFNNSFLSLILTVLYFFMFLYGNYFFIMFFSSYKRTRLKYKVIYFIFYILFAGILTYVLSLLSQDILISTGKVFFYLSIFLTFILFIDISNKEKYKQNFIFEKDENNINSINGCYPDIYHIVIENTEKTVPDENLINFCESSLKKNNFTIYDNHKANYDCPLLAIVSMLNMEYCQNISVDIIEDLKNSGNYYFINNLSKFFLKNNYKINFMHPSLANCFPKLIAEDICYIQTGRHQNKILLSMLFSSLWYITCAAFCIKRPFNKEAETQKSIETVIQQTSSIFNAEEQPSFNFIHIKSQNKSYSDSNNILCIEVSKLINSVKETMKPNSVIVLQNITSGGKDKDFSVLSAIYVPPEYDFNMPEEVSLVNFYRYILNYFFKTESPILKDEFYTFSPVTQNIKVITKKI